MNSIHINYTNFRGEDFTSELQTKIQETGGSISALQTEITIKCTDKDLFKIKKVVSDEIARCILKNYNNVKLKSFLHDTYFFLKPDEHSDIIELFNELQKSTLDTKEYSVETIYLKNILHGISEEMLVIIDENETINIDGIIRFKSKQFDEKIAGAVDKVVERYMADKEYDEFMKLLKYFVSLSDSKIDTVILKEHNNRYSLLDENGRDITKDKMAEYMSEHKNRVTNEDMIMGILMDLNPQKIIIDCIESKRHFELLTSVRDIFQGKVSYRTSEGKEK